MSKMRWRIATALDRSPRFCWANLVSWALRSDGYTLWSMRDDRDGTECRAESLNHRDRSCYCGKFRCGERSVPPSSVGLQETDGNDD